MSELWLELSELTGSEKVFARARTGIGRELAITKRRLSNTTSFRCWLSLLKKGGVRQAVFRDRQFPAYTRPRPGRISFQTVNSDSSNRNVVWPMIMYGSLRPAKARYFLCCGPMPARTKSTSLCAAVACARNMLIEAGLWHPPGFRRFDRFG